MLSSDCRSFVLIASALRRLPLFCADCRGIALITGVLRRLP